MTALDRRLYTVTIFVDFSKAFDTVNKTILLRKLDGYGFRNDVNDFLNSYLSDRKMYVGVQSDSTVRTTNIGLPQGSVTSSWLSSLYINDMNRTSDELNFIHFADDTTVYMSGRDLKALCENVSEELNKVNEWLKANRLSLNIDKTYFMIHTHNNYDINDSIIRIRDRLIKHVTSFKFWGLTINDNFSYNEHVFLLYKQLSRTKGILYRLSSYVPPIVIRKIYYALFYSRMIYGVSVWGGGNLSNVCKIDRINRSAINTFICNLQPNITPPLKFEYVYKLNCLTQFHKYKFQYHIRISLYKNSRNDSFP